MRTNEKYFKKIEFSINALTELILKIDMAINTKAKLPRISENQCAPIITLDNATENATKIKKEKIILRSFDFKSFKANDNQIKITDKTVAAWPLGKLPAMKIGSRKIISSVKILAGLSKDKIYFKN
jgi:hypothetical protein